MAKVKTVFCGSDLSGHNSELQLFKNINDEIFISIEDPEEDWPSQFIALDLETAMALRDWLTKEIKS